MTHETLQFLEENPELKDWMRMAMVKIESNEALCDGEHCYAPLTPTTFFVHLTPENKAMMLCVRCLHVYRLRNNLQFNQ
jgi:hypothetical protein